MYIHNNTNRRVGNCYVKARVSAKTNLKFLPFDFREKIVKPFSSFQAYLNNRLLLPPGFYPHLLGHTN